VDSMGGMLTYGLGARACPCLIVGYFHLKFAIVPVGGGGSSVRKSSDVAKLVHNNANIARRRYQDEEDEEISPELCQITITIGWNGTTKEKTYVTTKTRADSTVTILNLVDTKVQNIKLQVTKLTRSLTDFLVTSRKR